jgi:hypothetical protein
MTTTHDAGAIFNLDASGGLPAVVAAMLVGSTPDAVMVLPAIPTQWPRGRVSGLLARGGIIVDELRWSEGGISIRLSARAGTEWLRPARTRLVFPRPIEVVQGLATRLSPTLLEVELGGYSVVLESRYSSMPCA